MFERKNILNLTRSILPIICILLISASLVMPLSAQLNPARDLTGKWQSSFNSVYYELDPTDPTLPMNDITTRFSMDITQQDAQIDIVLHMVPISYVTDSAYWAEYGFGGVPPILDALEFKGTISSSGFSTVEQYTSFSPEHLDGTFTTDIITATLSGDSWRTDTNAIIVSRTSSPTASPFKTPTPSSSTLPQTSSNDLGTVSLVRGSAWLTNEGEFSQLSSKSQVGSGNIVKTSDDSIVKFSYPDIGGVVCLGSDTEVGWVALKSNPAPDSTVSFTMYPPNVKESFDWGEEGLKLLEWTEAGAAIEMLATGAVNPYILGAEVIVHGGIILVHYGQFYIKENGWPQLVQIPQGFVQGQNTEYSITVSNTTTVIQAIEGPLIFLDPITGNKITLNTGFQLTLPADSPQGFSMPSLISDMSVFLSDSIDNWWTPATTDKSLLSVISENPEISAAIILLIIVPVAVMVGQKSKGQNKKRNDANSNMPVVKLQQINTTSFPPPPPEATVDATFKTAAQAAPQQISKAFCPNCGNKLAQNKNFCPVCGEKLT
jgi:hypothetical protein